MDSTKVCVIWAGMKMMQRPSVINGLDTIVVCNSIYRIRSIRRRSWIEAAPPDMLKEIVAALEY